MFAATALVLSLFAAGAPSPCADSAEVASDFWREDAWDAPSFEPCDVEDALLFAADEGSAPGERSGRPPPRRAERPSERASFALERTAGSGLVSTTRHQARRDGWSHRLEIRGEPGAAAFSRREIAWRGADWKLIGGDLVDSDLAPWPRGLPRRALPSGWRAARGTGASTRGFDPEFALAAPRLQGAAAGVSGRRWSAYALRAWNPVETGREPAWSPPWTLSHAAAGVSLDAASGTGAARNGTLGDVSLFLSETRLARGDSDSLPERLAAVRLASPEGDWALLAALLETRAADPAWAVGVEGRHRFPAPRAVRGSGRVDFLLRQRGATWTSAWDPAVPKVSGGSGDAKSAGGPWGAGEYRLASATRFSEDLALTAEHRRAWNPGARTGRSAWRGGIARRLDAFRIEGGGIWRATRAASGNVSLHRALEVEGTVLENPGWRARAWRAWNAEGPTNTGLFVGMEPDLGAARLRMGGDLRIARVGGRDRFEGTASGGLAWAFARGWSLEADALLPWDDAREARWRAVVRFGGAAGEAAAASAEESTEDAFEAD